MTTLEKLWSAEGGRSRGRWRTSKPDGRL